ncbi:hypothetical protein FA13DRAFT_1719022 [Coprinellus micaceus]|uniref:Uncharacterized protein n=1 Tax=Coprinellus micaceus TaxID=71717 RepID=A0A4Y7SC59_COPMI|nr:hypothetical protein FA13DRAFT_1719022 [Coprinellus micaceus]
MFGSQPFPIRLLVPLGVWGDTRHEDTIWMDGMRLGGGRKTARAPLFGLRPSTKLRVFRGDAAYARLSALASSGLVVSGRSGQPAGPGKSLRLGIHSRTRMPTIPISSGHPIDSNTPSFRGVSKSHNSSLIVNADTRQWVPMPMPTWTQRSKDQSAGDSGGSSGPGEAPVSLTFRSRRHTYQNPGIYLLASYGKMYGIRRELEGGFIQEKVIRPALSEETSPVQCQNSQYMYSGIPDKAIQDQPQRQNDGFGGSGGLGHAI